MAYNFHILSVVNGDIQDGIEHYEGIYIGLSLDFELCIEEGYADILNQPLGYQIRYKDVRIKFIRRFPYGIHYVVRSNDVIVISIFHHSKNPKKWVERCGKT